MPRALAFSVFAALAVPGFARAGDVAMVQRDLPLAGARELAAAAAAPHFNMVGIHWQGSGRVLFRAHRLHGRWAAWVEADADAGPDALSPERRATRDWHDANLVWTGASDELRYRTIGDVRRIRAYFLWSRVERTAGPTRALSLADTPAIIPRAGWKADESIRRRKPQYASSLRFAVVHHTAGSNTYSRSQAAAVVRGIEVYHVKANGWNDIGYNFLVDRYGQVFEGRYGGVERNVVGAHAEGFNTGSVGVALIGNYGSTSITAAQRSALVSLLAWRLDVAHVDSVTTLPWRSGGNPKFRAGRTVTLRAVSGHRDIGYTSCPGNAAYAQLPSISREVAQTGLPKLYEPVVEGAIGRKVRFRARLSTTLAWTVRVTNVRGAAVAAGRGTGAAVDWTWDSARAGAGPFAWAIEAAGVRSATGSLGGEVEPPQGQTLTGLSASPAVVFSGIPGSAGTTTVGFTLGVRARVTATVLDSSGVEVVTLLDEERPPGRQTLSWVAGAVPDGRYTVKVLARPPGRAQATASVAVVVDHLLTGFALTPPAFSPNGDGVNDTIDLAFSLAAPSEGRLEVFQNGALLATPLSQAPLDAGAHAVDWNGAWDGRYLPDGSYLAALTFRGVTGDLSFTAPFTIDTVPPELRILDPANLRFWLSEPATVTLVVNGVQVVQSELQGEFTLPRTAQVQTLSGYAADAAGNVSPTVQWP